MNVFEVNITQQAESHMREIAWYIAVKKMNPDAADGLIDCFGEAFTKLRKNPEKHSILDEEPWKDKGIRKTRVKNFLIYFWIDTENAIVNIIGVVYAGREQNDFLNSLQI